MNAAAFVTWEQLYEKKAHRFFFVCGTTVVFTIQNGKHIYFM
jgi:hypothetical protein